MRTRWLFGVRLSVMFRVFRATGVEELHVVVGPNAAELPALLDELGVSITAAEIEANGLGWAFDQIRTAAAGNDSVMRQLIGSQEAVMAVLALSGENAEAFASALDQTTVSERLSGKVFEGVADLLKLGLNEIDLAPRR